MQTERGSPGLLGLVALLAGVCLLWLPHVGWAISPWLFLFAALLWAQAVRRKGRWTYQCQSCNRWFSIDKDRPSS